jgi:LysR family transcriptional regulator, glycine cleavage system transcriptional activator
MQRLPPLNALRYFLVAAETLSFKQTAEQLYVTQAAISQHIRTLETHLGKKLFIRRNREVVLSEDGQRLLPFIRDGFTAFSKGVAALQTDPRPNVLNITVVQSFASRWLVPRLSAFQKQYPHISVRLNPSNNVLPFTNSDLDLAIRFGQGKYEGLESRFLLGDKLYLVCHPSLVEKGVSIETLEMLPMLEENSGDFRVAWQQFFDTHGLLGDKYRRVLQVEDSTTTIVEAALAGQGMAMVRHSLVYEQIQKRQLVKLFDFEFSSDYSYFLVAPEHHFEQEKIRCFETWLRTTMTEIN